MPAHHSLQPVRISARAVFWKHQFKACANLLPGPFGDHNLFFLELTLLVARLCATAWCRRAREPCRLARFPYSSVCACQHQAVVTSSLAE